MHQFLRKVLLQDLEVRRCRAILHKVDQQQKELELQNRTAVEAKLQMEAEYLDKFCRVLNEKKKKVVELQGELEPLRSECAQLKEALRNAEAKVSSLQRQLCDPVRPRQAAGGVPAAVVRDRVEDHDDEQELYSDGSGDEAPAAAVHAPVGPLEAPAAGDAQELDEAEGSQGESTQPMSLPAHLREDASVPVSKAPPPAGPWRSTRPSNAHGSPAARVDGSGSSPLRKKARSSLGSTQDLFDFD